jgi:NAD-dependent dihydropyrimidine dehydrogenase PreA subunit
LEVPTSDPSDVYRRLQRHLDEMPVAFPATASGVEQRLLQRLFTPEQAEAALLLSAVPEPLVRIASRDTRREPQALERLLEGMAERGLILATGGGARPRRYGKAPLAVGIYEMQVDQLTAELQREFEQYGRDGFSRAFLTGRTNQMRTIPVNARFVPDRSVGRYDDARRLVDASGGPFAVINCVCRQGKDLLRQPCRSSSDRRVCLLIGPFTRGVVRSGRGEALGRDEVRALLERAERDGLVLQPSNTRDPAFICFCCSCCCGVLGMARQMPRPADYVSTNFRAAVDEALCAECGSCLERCPMDALRVADGACRVAVERCIGCGLCVGRCAAGALRLETKPRAARPPRDLRALYARITIERFGVLGAASRALRAVLGRRV